MLSLRRMARAGCQVGSARSEALVSSDRTRWSPPGSGPEVGAAYNTTVVPLFLLAVECVKVGDLACTSLGPDPLFLSSPVDLGRSGFWRQDLLRYGGIGAPANSSKVQDENKGKCKRHCHVPPTALTRALLFCHRLPRSISWRPAADSESASQPSSSTCLPIQALLYRPRDETTERHSPKPKLLSELFEISAKPGFPKYRSHRSHHALHEPSRQALAARKRWYGALQRLLRPAVAANLSIEAPNERSRAHLSCGDAAPSASPSCRKWPQPEPRDPTEDLGEQRSRHRHFGQLEHDVAPVAYDPGANLHQLLT